MTREATPVSHGTVTHGDAASVPARESPGPGEAAAPEVAQTAIDALSARVAGENFPVALRALPRRYRRHLMAVYRFARLVDDIGDEAPVARAFGDGGHTRGGGGGGGGGGERNDGDIRGDGGERDARDDGGDGTGASRPGRQHQAVAANRLRLLDLVEQDLDRAFSPGAAAGLPVVKDLGRTAAECAIPAEPFRMLIQANRQDQTVSRYDSFDALLGYCRLSANPVGHTVLHIFGMATPERMRLSDLVCTALQLAEHWQDVAEDFARDRIYLPRDDMAAFGCTEGDLADAANATRRAAQPMVPPRLRELLRSETERARRLLDEGAALTGTLHGWARLAVAGYVAGGRATLTAIAASDFDVFSTTPRPGRAATVTGLARAYVTGR